MSEILHKWFYIYFVKYVLHFHWCVMLIEVVLSNIQHVAPRAI
jgi:hypothetical protein